MHAIVVFMTAANRLEAENLAEILVKTQLAACVQILPEITSFYCWENKINKEAEILLLAKTTFENFDALEKAVRENHSYQTPEIVAVRAEQISNPYLQWLLENTANPSENQAKPR